MSSKLIIVADMQRFKLFSCKKDPLGRESVELLKNIDSLETHKRMSEKVSDRQGNFKSVGASGKGEDHDKVLEEERRRIKEIAEEISQALKDHSYDIWFFAAPKAINNKILECLTSEIINRIGTNLHSDLTKIPNDEILGHFTKA